MGWTRFKIDTYRIEISREMRVGVPPNELKFPVYIVCSGQDTGGQRYQLVIYFLEDGTGPFPDHRFNGTFATMYIPRSEYEWFVDLLRNERPVYCYLDPARPEGMALHTSDEPVGENEVKSFRLF